MPVCTACGQQAPAAARFCSACGTPLRPAGGPVGESRRRVTVLFSDLAGSTRLGEQLDPESLRRVMASYYAEMRRIIERHGGSLEKFIGDAVMAVFGIPLRREDDALRAIRAAAEMRTAQKRLNEDLHARFGVVLEVRTGVNTGEVVAGDPGVGEPFVTGDAVNVAARLEQASAVGEIIVGPETERLVRDAAELVAIEPLELKGKSARVPAFRLVGVAPDPGAARGALDSPLVGRGPELAALTAALERCAEGPRSELVTVVGAPGIGKSRLVREFEARAGRSARFLRGRCLSYGEGGTFWPVAEVVRGAAGIRLEDSPDEARAKLAALMAGDEAGETVVRLVAAAIGLEDVPHQPEEALWAVRRLLHALAAERPLVVVLDDLQWAEPGMLDLVTDLATARIEAPVLVLGLGRPELRDLRPDAWAEAGAPAIRLDALGEQEARALVTGLVAGLDADVAERIAEASGGNPLFAGELVRSLVEDGTLERRDGTLTAVQPLTAFAVPPTLEALLASRLERLRVDERAVAESASVVGEEFLHEELAVLAPEAVRPALASCLTALVRHEVIAPADAVQHGFRFAHLLIRDVTYQGMLKERRAELHERFADWLEQRAGERLGEVEDIVAFHLAEAYRYRASLAPVGDHERRLARRAHEHLVSAGQRALARLDRAGAIKLLRAAVDLLPEDDAGALEARLEIVNALGEIGQADAAVNEAAAVTAAAEAAGLRSLALHARLEGLQHWMWSDPAGAADDLARLPEQAIAQFEADGDRRGLARAWRMLGMHHFGAERFTAAADALATAIDHARATGDALAERVLRPWYLAAALVWGPLPVTEGIRRAEEYVDEVRGRPFDELHARFVLCLLLFMAQRHDDARAVAEQAEVVIRDLGLAREASLYDDIRGYGEWLARDLPAAEAHLRRAFERADEGGRWTAAMKLAEVYMELGRYEEAGRLADRAAAATVEQDLQVEAAWRAVKARVLAHGGDVEGAERLAREAVRITAATDEINEQAGAWSALGVALAAAGRREDAGEAFATALELYDRKENLAGAAIARALRQSVLTPKAPST